MVAATLTTSSEDKITTDCTAHTHTQTNYREFVNVNEEMESACHEAYLFQHNKLIF